MRRLVQIKCIVNDRALPCNTSDRTCMDLKAGIYFILCHCRKKSVHWSSKCLKVSKISQQIQAIFGLVNLVGHAQPITKLLLLGAKKGSRRAFGLYPIRTTYFSNSQCVLVGVELFRDHQCFETIKKMNVFIFTLHELCVGPYELQKFQFQFENAHDYHIPQTV